MVEIPQFGEGFWIMVPFLLIFSAIAVTCVVTKATLDNVQVLVALAGALGISPIIMFWFTSRGQTSQQLK